MTDNLPANTENLPANRVATSEPSKAALIPADEYGVRLTSLEDMYRFAKYVCVSGLAPKGMDKPESILVAVQSGLEIGFRPMQALQNVVVVNGKPRIYGDAGLALIRGRGLLEDMKETWTGKIEDGTRECTITMKRKGQSPITREFSIDDAKKAGLWGKKSKDGYPTPWVTFPERMLRYRALAFAMRDLFSDVLMGIGIVEEDYIEPPKERNITAEATVTDPRALALSDRGAEPATPPPTPTPMTGDEPPSAGTTIEPEIVAETTAPMGLTGAAEAAAVAEHEPLIPEIAALIEKSKASKVDKAMKAVGIKWDEGEAWELAGHDKLVALRSFLKC